MRTAVPDKKVAVSWKPLAESAHGRLAPPLLCGPVPANTPRARRLRLAAALALATVAACVTALTMNDEPAERRTATAPITPPDDGPGLLSFATPSTPPASARNEPEKPSRRPSAPNSPAPHTRPKHTPARSPAPPASSPKPVEHGTSVRSVNYPDRYWHLSAGLVRLDPVTSAPARRAATFTRVKGLADARCWSFATADGSYLRHREFLLRAEPDDGSRLFTQDATFCPRPSAQAGAVTLESLNYPGRFLRHQNFQLRLDPYQNTDLYRADSAFRLVDGLS
ncbi:AbfB domain-containing protein [Streptomyces sp. MC1]|nr:AbfB domain-containing protein [Streptomyces sp. MC1]